MIDYLPTKQDLELLTKYIGKEIKINVHVDESSWDYGDIEHNIYDVNYKMKLTKVTLENVIGLITEEGVTPEEKKWKYKGNLMVQPFNFKKNEELGVTVPWYAGTSKVITIIQCCDEILYDIMKKQSITSSK